MSEIFINAGVTCLVVLFFWFIFISIKVLTNPEFDAKEEMRKNLFFFILNCIFRICFYGVFICFIGWVWS